jgi:hypothetical protein
MTCARLTRQNGWPRLQAGAARLGNPNGAEALRRAQKGNADSLRVIKAAAADRAEQLRPVIEDLRARSITSLPGIAAALNEGGFVTARGGKWHASSVRNLLARLAPEVIGS